MFVFEGINPDDIFTFLSKEKEVILQHYPDVIIPDEILKILAKNAN
ncbi:hypothetical protein IJU97_03365 [bacterium]|nr:hypothetical protein [bacterium]